MQLQGFPVQPKGLLDKLLQFRLGAAKQVNLQLTIQFNQQWVPLPSGRFKFGLKAGELRLKLENGEISRTSGELGGSFSQKESQTRAGIVQSVADATNENNAATVRTETPGGTGNSIQVTTKGSKENPAWVFQAESQPVLQGLIQNAKLGTLNVSARPCRVAATFEVSLRDVCLTDAEGLWPPDISPNKRAVLDRAIMHLLKSRSTPYLSRAELHYD